MDFPLFAYGTLKRGFPAHERWCVDARRVLPARCDGSLFQHHDGYPVLFVPAALVLAVGGPDAHDDVCAVDREAGPVAQATYLGVADGAATTAVGGELLYLPYETLRLSEIDAYEGFVPGRPSLFVRVLVRVALIDSHEHPRAWTYAAGSLMTRTPLTGLRDRWPRC